ncbi:MAG: dihydroorotase [Candidatus Syntropharchaeia archaeon]
METVIKNGGVFFNGEIQRIDVLIRDGRIAEIGKDLKGGERIDARNLLVLPGAIDVHVHFRDMNQKEKEDWYTGSFSAAAGGVTTVIDQPNTDPPTNTVRGFEKKLEEARKKSVVDFGLNGGTEKIGEVKKLWNCGVTAFGEIFMFRGSIEREMEEVKKLGALACLHAEDGECISKDRTRPEKCEIKAIGDALEKFENKMHFCHVSTGRGIELIKNSSSTMEVTPHHLFLTKKDVERLGTFGKMNPPLRSEESRMELWNNIEKFDVIASDHAPHTEEEKEVDFFDAPPGVPGVETMVPLMLTAVKNRLISLKTFLRLLCSNPAKIFGLKRKGEIKVGNDADLIIVNVKKEKKIKGNELHSKVDWTPFEGFYGIFPEMTVVRGEVVFSDGDLVAKRGYGKFLKRI